MNLVETLIYAKEGNESAINHIVQHYSRYMENQMIRYNIVDKEDCRTNVKTRMIRAIDRFKI